MKIHYLHAFKDNYIWLLCHEKKVVVVDPGEASVVLDYLVREEKELTAILLTHEHHDHMGGVAEILSNIKVPVYGNCSAATHPVQEGINTALFEGVYFEIIHTPGHTALGVCYLVSKGQEQFLFCGDTLFSAGCGRVFTGDFTAMFHSLNRLKALKGETRVYPGHEYTLKNLAFAQFLEPNNTEIQQYIKNTEETWHLSGNTLPSTIHLEKIINPFLRCNEEAIMHHVAAISGKNITSPLACFTALRKMKDNF